MSDNTLYFQIPPISGEVILGEDFHDVLIHPGYRAMTVTVVGTI
jgi:hypothetical protein